MSQNSSGPSAVSLNLPKNLDGPPVWPLDSADGGMSPALPTKCARHEREGGICCKDLKDHDGRTLVDPDIIRDVVIGLSDGLTVPFALAAGLSSLGESKLVVLGGIAELIAGAISMGIGGFLASQAERDQYRFQRRHISTHVLLSCIGEIEREVYAVLGPVGVDERTSRAVTKCLLDIGCEEAGSSSAVDEETQLRWKKGVGIAPFLLKFGHGLEEVTTKRLYVSAVTIGMGYLVGGIIPLIPYFFISHAHVALLYSCILTGVILLIFGAIKSRVTGAGTGIAGYIWGACSTLMVGGAAAGAAYGIVALLEREP